MNTQTQVTPKNQPAITRAIHKREHLSFVAKHHDGRLTSWTVPRNKELYWADECKIGEQYFREVQELAKHDPEAAVLAVCMALSGGQDFRRSHDTDFTNEGWGRECGFVRALAESAISSVGGAL